VAFQAKDIIPSLDAAGQKFQKLRKINVRPNISGERGGGEI
jgi:hypothetical protein